MSNAKKTEVQNGLGAVYTEGLAHLLGAFDAGRPPNVPVDLEQVRQDVVGLELRATMSEESRKK